MRDGGLDVSIELGATIGKGTVVWHLSQVRAGAQVGDDCVIGRGVFIDSGVVIGSRCKIQNNALLYQPASVADGVFIGPGAVLTNDNNPRSVTVQGELKTGKDWDAVSVHVCEGASIGANATCVAPVTIGRWAMVGAGAVVTADVPDYALVVGVPAQQIGWVGEAGQKLKQIGPETFKCPETGAEYTVSDGCLGARRHAEA